MLDTGYEAATTDAVDLAEVNEIAARSPLQLFWRRLKDDKVALTALGVIVFLILVAVFAPLIVKLVGAPPPSQQSTKALDAFGTPTGPSSKHLFGVDELGRDVFSRVVYGARVSLEVAFIATGISMTIGIVLGLIAGYYRGWVDSAISRLIDVLLAFPILLLALGLAAACSFGNGCLSINLHAVGYVVMGLGVLGAVVWTLLLFRTSTRREAIRRAHTIERRGWINGLLVAAAVVVLGLVLVVLVKNTSGGLIKPGVTVVIFVIAFANWTFIARIIRGQVLSLREKEFVEAARSLGAPDRRIIFREILPNLVAPIIVYATLLIPANILFEAALSYLGVGVQPPQASWGQMISDATSVFDTAWWFMTFPGIALLVTVLSFNLIGDGLQDALNPRTAKS
jgi:ABC-type dipeptide/oligopeptide/nickel transport system permease subunit